jgi:hypothetical protein
VACAAVSLSPLLLPGPLAIAAPDHFIYTLCHLSAPGPSPLLPSVLCCDAPPERRTHPAPAPASDCSPSFRLPPPLRTAKQRLPSSRLLPPNCAQSLVKRRSKQVLHSHPRFPRHTPIATAFQVCLLSANLLRWQCCCEPALRA